MLSVLSTLLHAFLRAFTLLVLVLCMASSSQSYNPIDSDDLAAPEEAGTRERDTHTEYIYTYVSLVFFPETGATSPVRLGENLLFFSLTSRLRSRLPQRNQSLAAPPHTDAA